MVDTSALAAVAAEIAKLRDGYVESLPAEFAALADLAAVVAADNTDAVTCRTALDQLHRRLHKLAGSGGTFGLSTLSTCARHLEQTTKTWLDGADAAVDSTARRDFFAEVVALPATLGQIDTVATSTLPAMAPVVDDAVPVHVWLVEDDEPLGRELAQVMGQFGYDVRLFTRVADVEAAASGLPHARKISSLSPTGDAASLGRPSGSPRPPDVLIMDVMFPDEGVNATEAVMSRPALRGLGCPLLFISAYGDFASRVRAARAGAAGFLLKPIDVPRLVDRLEKIFDDRLAAPYRVLIVDDDIVLSQHYRLVLTGAGMDVDVLNNPDAVIERISYLRPELVLMDIHMPEYSGPELATVIRHHDEWIGLPIVYLSTETDLDEQVKALGHGADDFLTKPISDARLAAAVRVRVSRSRQLADLMAKDSLTGLLKHSRIKEELAVVVARARRSGKAMSVVMIDIDHFKKVNDTYGHAAGDNVLKSISHLLRQRLRRTDIIGRYGGEEFAAILPDCDASTAQGVMEDIRARFSALRFRHGNTEFSCTLSAGVAASTEIAGDLLVAADQALYVAKHQGRNRITVAGAQT